MSEADKCAALVEEFTTEFFAANPVSAAASGLHQYDGQVADLSREGIERRLAYLHEFLQRAAAVDENQLDRLGRYDLGLVKFSAGQQIFQMADMDAAATMPMIYNWQIGVSNYVKRNYAPLPERVAGLVQHLKAIPGVLDAARANLKPALSRPVLTTALGMFGGQVHYLQGELTEQVMAVNDKELMKQFDLARDNAVMALKDFLTFLHRMEKNVSDDFAIGRDRYQKLLWAYEMVDLPLDEVLAIGEADLARNKARLLELASLHFAGHDLRTVVAEMGREHTSSERLIEETRGSLERIRQFLLDEQIVSVPSEVRALVEETPPYMRWAFAFMSSPGPFEQVADQAFYYLTLPDPSWPPEKQDEWLTKFDRYTLDDISVHETYPGHYVNFLHMKNAPSRASKVFRATTYVEGWAHYCEQMMIAEAGYGKAEFGVKLEIAQLLEALVRNVRYVNAINMHVNGLSVDEATSRFVADAYMEEATGRAEAVRGTFDPGYFAYNLGKLMILKLRADYQQEQGDSYDRKGFHDRFLSFGSPPIKLLRPLVLAHDDGKLL